MDSSLLPATVFVAIAIFFIKEILEQLRKYQIRKREILAIKKMLADEIEKNNYTVSTLRRTLVKIKDENVKYEVSLNRTPSGALRVEFKKEDDDYGSSWPIPTVSRTIFDKIFVQLASLDIELFEFAKNAYESLAEVEHVRNSLIDSLEAQEWHPEGYLEGFAEYGIDELVDSYINLSKLYKECTGLDLDKHKLRSYA